MLWFGSAVRSSSHIWLSRLVSSFPGLERFSFEKEENYRLKPMGSMRLRVITLSTEPHRKVSESHALLHGSQNLKDHQHDSA